MTQPQLPAMQSVEVARFADPQEAEIAAGALRNAGIGAEAVIWRHALVEPLLHNALGGFAVRVTKGDEAAARALLAGWRTENPEALNWRRHPGVLTGLPLALLAIDTVLGMTVAAGKAGGGRGRRIAAVILIGLILLTALLMFWAAGYPPG